MTDSDLVKGIIQKDENSFKYLVENYKNLVFRTCFAYIKNREDAEDVTQNVFIQVYRNIDKFRGESSLSTWLYRIAVNQSINFLRQIKWKKLVSQIENVFGNEKMIVIPDGIDPEKKLVEQQKIEILNRAIDLLPSTQKTAFILHKYDDLPHEQIAEIMGISISAVESLIFRAKANLQKRLLKLHNEFF